MRTLSSLMGRRVQTESGDSLGRVNDLRCALSERTLTVKGLVVGTRGELEHLGLVSRTRTPIPWSDVVRIERRRIIVRDRES